MEQRQAVRQLLLGGILPVVIFTLVEEYFGILWGLVAGMAFGLFEMGLEWVRFRKVQTLTLVSNALILVMGGVSLFTQEGVWFKLQPALIEAAMALAVIGSVVVGRPLMVVLARQQGLFSRFPPAVEPALLGLFRGFTLRMGLFFAAHAALATWAALTWSTRAWALLKGVGFTASLFVYVILEGLVLRTRLARHLHQGSSR